MRRLVRHGLVRVAVEGQRDAVMPGQIEQPRQQIGIAVGGDEQIGVVLLEQVTHAEDELAAVAAGERVLPAVDLDQQVATVAARWVTQFTGHAQRHDSERRQPVLGLPWRIERLQVDDSAILMLDGAVRQREDAAVQHVTLG